MADGSCALVCALLRKSSGFVRFDVYSLHFSSRSSSVGETPELQPVLSSSYGVCYFNPLHDAILHDTMRMEELF